MSAQSQRIVSRWLAAGEVIRFQPKPSLPKIEISGKKYVLSDDAGPLSADFEDTSGRVLRGPSHGSKWKYLWVYDTDRQTVAMWRATDGNEKVFGSAKSESHLVFRLEKKGHLNRVSNEEFRKIEAAMERLQQDELEALKRSIRENESNYQRTVNELAKEYFDRRVRPQIQRAIAEIEQGVTPIGFKPFGPKGEPSPRQMMVHAISKILARDFTPRVVDEYLQSKGVDDTGQDNQASHWAVHEIQDALFEDVLPPR